jgi:hypothetical protein
MEQGVVVLPQPASVGRSQSGECGLQGEIEAVCSCTILPQNKEEAAGYPPSTDAKLGHFLGLGDGFSFGLGFFFSAA